MLKSCLVSSDNNRQIKKMFYIFLFLNKNDNRGERQMITYTKLQQKPLKVNY